jgi:hypothetical protein
VVITLGVWSCTDLDGMRHRTLHRRVIFLPALVMTLLSISSEPFQCTEESHAATSPLHPLSSLHMLPSPSRSGLFVCDLKPILSVPLPVVTNPCNFTAVAPNALSGFSVEHQQWTDLCHRYRNYQLTDYAGTLTTSTLHDQGQQSCFGNLLKQHFAPLYW